MGGGQQVEGYRWTTTARRNSTRARSSGGIGVHDCGEKRSDGGSGSGSSVRELYTVLGHVEHHHSSSPSSPSFLYLFVIRNWVLIGENFLCEGVSQSNNVSLGFTQRLKWMGVCESVDKDYGGWNSFTLLVPHVIETLETRVTLNRVVENIQDKGRRRVWSTVRRLKDCISVSGRDNVNLSCCQEFLCYVVDIRWHRSREIQQQGETDEETPDEHEQSGTHHDDSMSSSRGGCVVEED